ncbi:hypothetical protein GCM10027566_39110 [Arachidicoccus ginsenosidivorans]|uniref:Uncharacterized protein n=1 Tax=Arachidicoccus ginsenosidivorans TaxID=496057 RepID=A0A5B8VT45_9BACT|nr:hypothetical protein [Arachidicoccus ginsenosidivorans]QEC73775.1 hypothetical protein FSB73_20995 [Arachidicoccus ginsenosidivorans]
MDNAFDDLMDFISELHQRDREKAAKEERREVGRKKGVEMGRMEAIKSFIANNPKDFEMTCQEMAESFEVRENLIRFLYKKVTGRRARGLKSMYNCGRYLNHNCHS